MPTNTATSFTSHTGNGTAGPFSISFSFFAETDIKVLVGGEFKTLNTHYTFTSGSQITFTSGNEPGNGVSIKFTRNTDISSKKIDFEDGSVLTEADLDTQNDQILFALQEFTDIVNNDLLLRDGSNTVIGSLQFEGANDDNFETKITVENPTTDRTITLPNITGTVVTRSDTGTVTSTMISNGTIVDGDINASANINGSKLSNDSVSLAKLGGGALPTDITIASANIVNGSIIEEDIATGTLDGRYYTETELDAGQLDNRYFTETELNSGQLDNRYFTESELNSGQLDNRYFTETELSSGALDARYFTETELTNGTLDSRYFTETELNNGQLDNRYFTETELNPSATTGANVLDARYYTEAEADARFYNLASSEEIQSGETWTAADNKVATTAAIDARIIDLVDDVGGFVPITNELSFPNTNPDINNGAGTLISIQALSTAYTSNGSGTFTIANGTIGNSTVTVTGATASTTFSAGFGMILETTSTLNTYTFHRLVPKATEVTTVAGNVSNVNTVAGIDSNVTTVAGIAANVTTVAGISSNVTSVAGSITNVNTVATNLSGVNAFADRYSSGSSNPTSNLDVGDLFFNTTDNELKVYNGSAWQSGVTATSNVALTTGNTFTGNNVFNDNVKALFGTGSDLEIFHNGSDSIINDAGTGNLKLQVGGSTKFTLDSSGRVLIGTTAARVESNGFAAPLQVEGTGTATSSVIIARNSNNASSSNLIFQKSRGTSVGSNTVIQNGDAVGTIIFEGSDGTNTDSLASIIGACDGTPGSNDVPGRLVFSTTADGAASPTERLRIDSSGRVLIGTTSGSDALVVDGGSDAGTITTNSTNSNGNFMTFNCSGTGKFFIGSAGSFMSGHSGTTNQGIRAEGALAIATGGTTERMRIDSSGNVGIGTTSPTQTLDVTASNTVGIAEFTNTATSLSNSCYTVKIDSSAHTSNMTSAGAFAVDTNSGRAMTIDGNGNVSIGSTTNSSGVRLNVVESRTDTFINPTDSILRLTNEDTSSNTNQVSISFTTKTTGANSDSAIVSLSDGSGSSNLLFFTDTNNGMSEKVRIDSSGNVGIGTTSPDAPLTIHNSSDPEIRFGYNSSQDHRISWDSSKVFLEADPENGNASSGIGFKVDGTQRLFIDASGNIGAPSGTNIFNASDSRVKTNVVDLDKGLSAIKSLRPVSFNWIDGFCDEEKDTLYGFIAQEVKAVDNNLIQDFATELTIDNNKIENVLRVNEKFIIPMLVKAIQELEAKVAALEAA